MNKIHFLAIICTVMLFASCKDDPKGKLTLHFKALYDGTTLPAFSIKPFDNGEQLQFTHLSMMFSDIKLFKAADEQGLDDIELVDLTFDDLPSAQEGYSLTISNIPAGTYEGIRFGVGVPPDVNSKKPADFPSSSPLSKTGYYWTAWSSYIFSKTEGQLDTLGNGTFDLGFAFHTGSDPLFRSAEGTLPIQIQDGKETDLTIAIDYRKLLQGVDIKAMPQNHNPEDTVQILKIVNNLGTAISLIQ